MGTSLPTSVPGGERERERDGKRGVGVGGLVGAGGSSDGVTGSHWVKTTRLRRGCKGEVSLTGSFDLLARKGTQRHQENIRTKILDFITYDHKRKIPTSSSNCSMVFGLPSFVAYDRVPRPLDFRLCFTTTPAKGGLRDSPYVTETPPTPPRLPSDPHRDSPYAKDGERRYDPERRRSTRRRTPTQ